jgi:uncharacterized membrane protein HdeD (DUF308 family)
MKLTKRFKKTRLQYGESAMLQSSLTLLIIGVFLVGLALITSAVPAIILGLAYIAGGLIGLIVGYRRASRTAQAASEPVEQDGYWHRYSRK